VFLGLVAGGLFFGVRVGGQKSCRSVCSNLPDESGRNARKRPETPAARGAAQNPL